MYSLAYAEWTPAEFWAAVGTLLKGQSNEGSALDALSIRLSALAGENPVLPVSRGRVALEMALQALAERHPFRDEVIVPGYICPSVIDAIEACGLKSVAADVGYDLNLDPAQTKRCLSSRSLAVVAAHMYGAPAQIADLEQICAQAGVSLVDDAAQVLGVDVDGRALGSFGEFGILSFSQSKTVVVGIGDAGGALIVNDPTLLPAIRRKWESLPPPSYNSADLASFVWRALMQPHSARVAYYAEKISRRYFGRNWRAAYRFRPRRLANTLASAALCQLDSLSVRIRGRIRVAQAYNSRLQQRGGPYLPQYMPARYLTRVMVLLPKGCDRENLRRALDGRGIQTRISYRLRTSLISNLPVTTDIAPRLLELPSNSRMSTETIEVISKSLNELVPQFSPA